jgi:hypothetical protein
VVESALEAADSVRLWAAPTLVYLCRLEAGGTRIAGVVAALDPARPPPLGPFLPPGRKSLGEDEVVVAEGVWPGSPPKVGSTLTLAYKPPEHHGPAPDQTAPLKLAGYLPLRGAAADPSLTPEFPGITDKEREAADWTLPFDDPDWQREVIRKEYTDRYWDEYRATPKAYVTLAAGRKLWGSRFGDLTSIRLAPKEGGDLDEAESAFRKEVLAKLDPARGGWCSTRSSTTPWRPAGAAASTSRGCSWASASS